VELKAIDLRYRRSRKIAVWGDSNISVWGDGNVLGFLLLRYRYLIELG
jgi:hypothetical protein